MFGIWGLHLHRQVRIGSKIQLKMMCGLVYTGYVKTGYVKFYVVALLTYLCFLFNLCLKF